MAVLRRLTARHLPPTGRAMALDPDPDLDPDLDLDLDLDPDLDLDLDPDLGLDLTALAPDLDPMHRDRMALDLMDPAPTDLDPMHRPSMQRV